MPLLATSSALFVAWQQPITRRFFPIGRLVSGVGQDRSSFEFVYIQGANDATKEGFQPFLAFPTLDRVYLSDELFPFFANRVMSRNRPDFAQFVGQLALDPNQADEMSILIRSGGVRATDSLELFPLPVFDPAVGCYQTPFLSHGIRHLPEENQSRILKLQRDEQLECRPQPEDPADPNAIRLLTVDDIPVGWVPRYLVDDAFQLLSTCEYFHVFVAQVNPPPAAFQQRLLCRLESCWPEGFVPFASNIYRPIPAEASHVEIGRGDSLP